MTRLHFPASLQAPVGREFWLLGPPPAAGEGEALGASLAARGLTRVLVQRSEAGTEALVVAQAAAEGSGTAAVAVEAGSLADALEAALLHGGERGPVALIASEQVVVELLEHLLGVPPREPSAFGLVSGRATCLRMGATGWLLAHHNVRDPGSVREGPEGLGRPK